MSKTAKKTKTLHTYTITLYGPGYEFLMGKLPERIWQYIKTECGGNADAYLEKWGADLPEDMQLWGGRPNVWDASADEEHLGDFLCYEVSGCAGMDGAQIDVHDEDGNLVYATEFMRNDRCFSAKKGKTPTICRSSDYPPSGNYRYFLFVEEYQGQWMKQAVEDYEFDPSKLILRSYKFNYDHFRQGIDLLDELWYGEEGLYRIDGTESPDNVFSESSWLEIFDAKPLCDKEMAKVIGTVDLPGCDWVSLLRRRPQFAFKCDKWAEMSGGDGDMQLNQLSEFPDKSSWNGEDWDSLLSKLPHFADKFDWSKLDGGQWGLLLASHPEFAAKCDWSKLSGWNWAVLLEKQPQFADKCDWSKLDGGQWVRLLEERPQFADKCDWLKLNGGDWARLLDKRPQIADKCDWSKLNGGDWARLLEKRPQFADKCDWSKLDGGDWARLLDKRPQFTDRRGK